MDNRNDTFIGSRWFYAICFAGLFVVETLIALFVRDAFIRPYMGDVLVVILIYCFVRMFITRPLRWLPLWIFLFACCIETLQYLQLVTLLGLQNCTLARVVLGTSFSLFAMLLGVCLCFLSDGKRKIIYVFTSLEKEIREMYL